MQTIASILRKNGYDVYCPFELKIENAWDMSQEDWAKKVFDADIRALNDCDIFLMITPGRNSTAGTNWEQGYAYAKGKRIIVLQYTDDTTSLMTFCGATKFFNCTEDDLFAGTLFINPQMEQDVCKTILT